LLYIEQEAQLIAELIAKPPMRAKVCFVRLIALISLTFSVFACIAQKYRFRSMYTGTVLMEKTLILLAAIVYF